MATFNTVSELIRILHDEPHLRDELRAVLLTQELLDLPASHAALTQEVRALSVGVRNLSDELREFIAATNQRLEAIEREMSEFRTEMALFRKDLSEVHGMASDNRRDITEMRETVEDNRRNITEMRETVEDNRRNITEMRETVEDNRRDTRAIHGITRELQRSFGDFKGNYAESAARKQAFSITVAFGRAIGRRLKLEKILTFEDLLGISGADGNDLDIPDNELISFHESDVMILATDIQTGDDACYIAVEASYTCDRTDTDRAIIHANLLRKFTHLPAYAAIAGIHRHDEIMDIIHKGDVFWFELDYARFAP